MDQEKSKTPVLLTLNIGSSSVKFAVFEICASPTRRLVGQYDDRDQQLRWTEFGTEGGTEDLHSTESIARDGDGGRETILRRMVEVVRAGPYVVRALVHRVVHGGDFAGPIVIDDPAVETLERFSAWAPLHQPACLAAIRFFRRDFPDLLHIACFDTAFHGTIPSAGVRFAIPRWLTERGIRRYGFHGLSFQSVWRKLNAAAPGLSQGRIVVAHLGGGSSLCGMIDGKSVATTMGLTPLDGVPMATRCGGIDPGVILHLWTTEQMSAQQVSNLLYRESGMLGMSGISGDMRELLANATTAAQEAVDVFVRRVAREIGALTVDLQGIDGLIFTGGIGENSPPIRAAICRQLECLGVQLDADLNRSAEPCLSAASAAVKVWKLRSDEETEMARQALPLC